MSKPLTETIIVKDMLEVLKGHPHEWKRLCPICGKDCNRTALVNVIYRFEVCSCDAAPYEHLVETIYHAKCFQESADEPRRV